MSKRKYEWTKLLFVYNEVFIEEISDEEVDNVIFIEEGVIYKEFEIVI